MPPTRRAPGTRRRAKRGDGAKLRARVLEVAEELLLESGSQEAVSIRAIAEGCSVTPPAIYLHFADKETLFREVCARRFDALEDHMQLAASAATDPLDELRLRGMAYVRFGLEHPETYRAVLDPQGDDQTSATGRAAFEHLSAAVERAASAGVLGDGDPRQTALVLWSGIHGITSLMISFPNLDWGDRDQHVEHMLDVLIEGLLSV